MIAKSLIRLAERRGLLQGDLSYLQLIALQHLMLDENEEASNLEYERMKYTILAGNVQLYQSLFDKRKEEERFLEEFVPRSEEEIRAVISMLEEPRAMKRVFGDES